MAYAPRILTLPADRPRLSRLLCFAFGALTTLSFAPFEYSLFAPLLLLPLLFVCLTVSPRDAAGHAFWYGVGLFLTGTYWIYISVVVFGQAPVWVAVFLMVGLSFIMALWLFLAGWLMSRLSQGEPMQLLLVAPAAWVLIEWLRGWVLTGFPWLAFGYAQIDNAFAGWAPMTGVYGVSFAVVISSASLLAVFMSRGRWRMVALALVLTPALAGWFLGRIEWTATDGQPVATTVLQYGISQDQKWLPEHRVPTLNYYRRETLSAGATGNSQLVVWPEVAVPSFTSREQVFLDVLQADARRHEMSVVFGILEHIASDDAEETIHNAVLMLDGRKQQVYRKRHLVPFGEYFPVPAFIRNWMRMMSLPHSDLKPGMPEQALLRTASGVPLATMVCYEDAYGAEQLYALPEARLLINVSNDAWFGDSVAPHQHLQIARMRSLEFGRDAVRATNTGISALIDYRGNVVARGKQFEQDKLLGRVQPRDGSTPYVEHGNAPVIGLALLLLAIFALRARH